MRTRLKEVSGIDWGDGAVMNCTWKGPRLKDVLNEAGINLLVEATGHVAFACNLAEVQDDTWYGGSVPLTRAMRDDADVILALEMNGKLLTPNHGYPVRVIVPGVAGARSVKWLDRVTVQEEESSNHYQLYDYKVLPPQATDKEKAKEYWLITPGLLDMPCNSIIAEPLSEETVTVSNKGKLEVRGYALPCGDQGPVTKVEVSTDNGKSWIEAEISSQSKKGGKWSWVLWKATVKMERGKGRRVLSRAIDRGGNTQDPNPQWNFRGCVYNGYGESSNLTVR
ncbi:MAG: hypothetical protein Q9191_001143 [Dirinaria sp. TL-2023a]